MQPIFLHLPRSKKWVNLAQVTWLNEVNGDAAEHYSVNFTGDDYVRIHADDLPILKAAMERFAASNARDSR